MPISYGTLHDQNQWKKVLVKIYYDNNELQLINKPLIIFNLKTKKKIKVATNIINIFIDWWLK